MPYSALGLTGDSPVDRLQASFLRRAAQRIGPAVSVWPTEFFGPEAWQVGAAIGLILAGFAVTAVIARFSGSEE